MGQALSVGSPRRFVRKNWADTNKQDICVPKELPRGGLGLEPGKGPGVRIGGRPWDGAGAGTGLGRARD